MAVKSKVRILFLSHFYPPEMGGAAARISGLSRWLVKFGHSVTVLTGYPNYPTGKIYKNYKNKQNNIEFIDGVKVVRAKVLAVSHRSTLVRLVNYFTLFFSALWNGIRIKGQFDIIIASSPPLTIGMLGMLLAWYNKIPWIFDIRDLMPGVAVEAGILKENGIVHKLSQKLANFLYRQATFITPVTKRKMIKIKAVGLHDEKIAVVPNGVDFDFKGYSKSNNWRKDLNLQDKFVLTYAGLIGIAQGVKIIIETADYLKNRSDIHFMVIGEGVEKNKLQKLAHELNLDNITFIGKQPKEVIPTFLESSNGAIIPLANPKLEDAVPSKLLEAWLHKLPVILIAGGEAAETVRASQGGIVVNSRDYKYIAEAIINLMENTKLRRSYGGSGYQFVKQNFGREKLARKMEAVILKILKDRK